MLTMERDTIMDVAEAYRRLSDNLKAQMRDGSISPREAAELMVHLKTLTNRACDFPSAPLSPEDLS